MNYTSNLNLYKWTAADQKQDTILEMSNNMDKIDSSLADKTSLSNLKNSTLYNNAIRDIQNITYSLPNVFNHLRNANTLKIAFWGDSITEGYNNFLDDTYVELFMTAIKRLLPNVTVQYTNFGLGGRTITNAMDDNYKATNPETDKTINFWRSWSTVGKSWKQHIVDYAPDLVIVAFGMNDTNGSQSDYNFYNNVSAMKSYLNTNLPNTDLALVSTIMPTENKTVYNQNSEFTLQIARATREFAKNNNIPLIDTNRLWRILLYGIDEERYTSVEYTNPNDCIGQTSYEMNLTISMSTYGADTNNPTDIKIRTSQYDSYGITVRLANAAGVNKVQLYDLSTGNVFGQVNAQSSNTIKIVGSTFIINGTTFNFYKFLRNGSIVSISNQQNISTFDCLVRNPLTETSVYQEIDLLGNVNFGTTIGTTGNGINHPTALGTYLSYFMACSPLINSIKNEYIKALSFPVTLYTEPTYQNGWTNFNTAYKTTIVKEPSGIVTISGTMKAPALPLVSGQVIFTLQTGYKPNKNIIVQAVNFSSGTPSQLAFDLASNGNLSVNSGTSLSASDFISFSISFLAA